MPERDEQEAVIAWADLMAGQYPELALMYSIPNGAHLYGDARRRAMQVAALKRQGMKPGVPDLCLPVARNGWHALYIEMKYGDNKPRDRQEWYLNRLAEENNLAVACWSAEEAIQVIVDYLTENPKDLLK